MQNIPRTDKTVKRGFLPKLDALGYWDYASIEVVVLGFYLALLGDPQIADELKASIDPHSNSAKVMYQVDSPTPDQRQIAKRRNFTLIYGGTEKALVDYGIAKNYAEGRSMVRSFHAAWPGVRMIQDRLADRYIERGYLETLFGAQLHPPLKYTQLNSLIQGCSAGLLKDAMRKTHAYLNVQGLSSHLVNQVHDELQLDMVREEIDRLRIEIPVLMDNETISKIVPIKTTFEISYTNWADKKDPDG